MNNINDYVRNLLLPSSTAYYGANATRDNDGISADFKDLLNEKMQSAMFMDQSGMADNPYLSSSVMSNMMGSLFPLPTSFSSALPVNASSVLDVYKNTFDSTSTAAARAVKSDFNDLIETAANKYGIDKNLVHAVIKMESDYNPNTRSHAGAAGLMQLMPATAKGLGITNLYDPAQNIDGGTKYLSHLLKNHNGDVELALAAYNAGPGNVRKYGGIPPFKETQNYVRKVMEHYMN